MAYHHLLVHRKGNSSQVMLVFKDLTEEELRTLFLVRFLTDACGSYEPDAIHAPPIRARIIRTERPHDAEADDYLRTYWQAVEETMRASGRRISSQPVGDSAIVSAGKDVTAEVLREIAGLNRSAGTGGAPARSLKQDTTRAEEVPPAAGNGELRKIGPYDVTGVLGEGTFGMVYEGIDPASQRRVAIKTLLKSGHDDATAGLYARCLRREVIVAGRISDPGIVQALDFGEDGDIAYVALEFVDARKLKSFFEEDARFEIGNAVIIMGDLCAALHAAHAAGIVHRNLKPGNVMIGTDGRAQLTDFGFAHFAGADAQANEPEEDGTLVGTPECMSPEAISGAGIDRRADLFAAGIILYQLLTGEKPFSGPGVWTIARKILQDNPPPPSSINSAITPHFDAVVRKALAKDPEDRYQTARELDVALQGAMWMSGPGKL